eukprot:746756-Hanusia_phi.AAC.6
MRRGAERNSGARGSRPADSPAHASLCGLGGAGNGRHPQQPQVRLPHARAGARGLLVRSGGPVSELTPCRWENEGRFHQDKFAAHVEEHPMEFLRFFNLLLNDMTMSFDLALEGIESINEIETRVPDPNEQPIEAFLRRTEEFSR